MNHQLGLVFKGPCRRWRPRQQHTHTDVPRQKSEATKQQTNSRQISSIAVNNNNGRFSCRYKAYENGDNVRICCVKRGIRYRRTSYDSAPNLSGITLAVWYEYTYSNSKWHQRAPFVRSHVPGSFLLDLLLGNTVRCTSTEIHSTLTWLP